MTKFILKIIFYDIVIVRMSQCIYTACELNNAHGTIWLQLVLPFMSYQIIFAFKCVCVAHGITRLQI